MNDESVEKALIAKYKHIAFLWNSDGASGDEKPMIYGIFGDRPSVKAMDEFSSTEHGKVVLMNQYAAGASV